MPESMLSIRGRLNTVRSIRKITNAMKLIASARYAKWKNVLDGNRAYLDGMEHCLEMCLQFIDFTNKDNIPSCMRINEGQKRLFIIVTSTLGLCGSYNYDLYKVVQANAKHEDDAIFIGEKGLRHFQDYFANCYDEWLGLDQNLDFDSVNAFRHALDALYLKNQYASVHVISTKYVNSMVTKPVCEKLLPVTKEDIPAPQEGFAPPLFEPDPSAVSDKIVPHWLDAVLYNRLVEAMVSEQTCRRNSMDNATDSADKLTDSLKLEFNKMRQQKITQEITEVVSGANASKR